MASQMLRPGDNGLRKWSCARDELAHREYSLVLRLRSTSRDGPATVLQTPGLPRHGDQWDFDNDSDPWATCRWNAKVTPVLEGEPNEYWDIEYTFSTKPEGKRCMDQQIEDPLLTPQQVSGAFAKFQQPAAYDRFGRPIVNSAWEPIRGPQVEFDANRPSVKIVQNVPLLQLDLCSYLVDKVNDAVLWDLPPRCVKLSSMTWEKKFYGQCFSYYVRTFEFDVNFATFDRIVDDQASKMINGRWLRPGHYQTLQIDGGWPDPYNPSHFLAFTDPKGNATKGFLNGQGLPAGACVHGSVLGGVNGAAGSNVFVSVQGTNTGNSLGNEAWWVQVVGPYLVFPAWSSSTQYRKGNLVSVDFGGIVTYYVALAPSFDSAPASAVGSNWADLGTFPPALVGSFNSGDVYNLGDLVLNPACSGTGTGTGTASAGVTTGQGSQLIQKYDEGNFLLLGIPTSL